MTPVSEGRLQRTGAFRDNQFSCGGCRCCCSLWCRWCACVRGRFSAQKDARKSVRVQAAVNLEALGAGARHLHQLRQKRKPRAGLAWKTSYPSVNVTLRRSALDSRVKESIITPLTQLRVGACLFITLLWTALTHVLHEISAISPSEATPPHCYSPCGRAAAKSPQQRKPNALIGTLCLWTSIFFRAVALYFFFFLFVPPEEHNYSAIKPNEK